MISDHYLNRPLSIYLNDLAARKMAPGGGSASALAAALGAGLNLMVINFTIFHFTMYHKEKDKKFAFMRSEQDKIIKRIMILIDKDCQVFTDLMRAISVKAKNIEDKYKDAANVPMEIAHESLLSMAITLGLAKCGNKNLMSDIGCALHFLKGAFYASRLNVLINLKYIKDEKFVKEKGKKLSHMKKEIDNISYRINKTIEV